MSFTLDRKISPSSAARILDDIELWRYEKEHPKRDTEYTATGSVLHCLVLEPDNYEKNFFTPDILPINKNTGKEYGRDTKAFKSWLIDVEHLLDGRKLVMPEEYKLACDMRDALLSDNRIHDIIDIDNMQTELKVEWIDEETGQACIGYIDLLSIGNLIDIKATSDTKYSAVRKQCHNLGYFLKMATYQDAVFNLYGYIPKPFIVAVRSSKPHSVAIYEIDDETMKVGLQQFRKAITKYRHCVNSGVWRNQIDTETIGFYQSYF